MPIGQTLGLVLTALVEMAVLSGLFSRQRFGRCLGFAAYLTSVLVTTLLVVTLPNVFFRPYPWQVMQIAYASLRHVMALELAFYTFRAFPVARRLARSVLWITSVLALALPFAFPADLTNFATVYLEVVPRMNLASVALFFGLGALILWYHLPLEPMHKAIIMGIAPYLSIYSLLLHAVRPHPAYVDMAEYANQFAWIALTVFWAWVAWQPRAAPRQAAGDLAAQPLR